MVAEFIKLLDMVEAGNVCRLTNLHMVASWVGPGGIGHRVIGR